MSYVAWKALLVSCVHSHFCSTRKRREYIGIINSPLVYSISTSFKMEPTSLLFTKPLNGHLFPPTTENDPKTQDDIFSFLSERSETHPFFLCVPWKAWVTNVKHVICLELTNESLSRTSVEVTEWQGNCLLQRHPFTNWHKGSRSSCTVQDM